MVNVVTLNDDLNKQYSDYVAGKSGARFGHDLEWAKVLRDTYGVSIEHLVALEGEKVVGICPLFLCKPFFGGLHYQTSLFPSYFGPLYDSNKVLDSLLEIIKEKTSSVRYTEILSPKLLLASDAKYLPYLEYPDYTYYLSLNNSVDNIFKRFRNNYQRILRKVRASKEIESIVDAEGALINEFYKLYVDVYGHKHGFIPHVKKLFENVVTHYVGGTIRIYFARVNNNFIGSIFTFWGHNEIYYAWSAAKLDNVFNPAHFLIWKIIQDGVSEGYPLFNMGEAQLHNDGLNHFKKGWGTEFTKSYRYFIPGEVTQPTVRLFERYAWMNKIIAKLPSAIITNLLSPAIRFFL